MISPAYYNAYLGDQSRWPESAPRTWVCGLDQICWVPTSHGSMAAVLVSHYGKFTNLQNKEGLKIIINNIYAYMNRIFIWINDFNKV